ncbi:MAG: T9SS type A sorting domain-containing protein [Bacteroidetes bacterium]|nr:T9SS type A sorting domain-containing protein [Bacteroidota bacterium]
MKRQMNSIGLIGFMLLITISSINAQMQQGLPAKFKNYYGQTWDGAKWDTVNNNLASYNADKTLRSILTLKKQDTTYTNYTKDSFLYFTSDPSGKISQDISQTWVFGKWVNDRRTTYTYNSTSNLLLYQTTEQWASSKWTPSYVDSSSFDKLGRLSSVIHATYINSKYVYNSKYLYSYNTNSSINYKEIYTWTSGAWVLTYRDVYKYDSRYLVSEIKKQAIAGTLYIDLSRNIFEYEATVTSMAISNTNALEIKIYPNPCTDKLSVILPEGGNNYSISLYDMQGKRVMEYKTEAERTALLDISSFQNGVYLLQCTNETNSFSRRIIKK